MASAPPNKIERAHQMYREGRYQEALGFYTDALAMAKTKPQKIALHSNRAACYLKLHHFKKAAEECTSVLELDQNHTGALMLRAQTLVTLKEYNSALFDVNRLIELNPSSEVYQNLEARKSLASIPESEAELEEEECEVQTEVEEENEEARPIKGEQWGGTEISTVTSVGIVQNAELNRTTADAGVIASKIPSKSILSEQGRDQTIDSVTNKPTAEVVAPQAQHTKGLSEKDSKGWQSIPKPKGHSALDYARWDRVEDDSSEDEDDDDDEEAQPQYRFRVRTVGVRQVK
ncbi:N-terminal acetyltransferase A, auxiliary subunit [Parasponia andersonii]|uniref:N-terminal acetyltransferase A, auxiliary subunit n=1 Tax=Parasponia andersonii TaxID=3476 RepID=A0A2P5DV37_PARAD|nr:N-terminal acetyltransferase A, auxiliary subunit [Parasponia andersonii]